MASPLAGRSIVLAGLFSAKAEDLEAELAGFAARIAARGGRVVAQVIQRRGVSRSQGPGGARRMNAPMDPATFFGKGKAQEIAALCRATHAELTVVCARLSPSQRA